MAISSNSRIEHNFGVGTHHQHKAKSRCSEIMLCYTRCKLYVQNCVPKSIFIYYIQYISKIYVDVGSILPTPHAP